MLSLVLSLLLTLTPPATVRQPVEAPLTLAQLMRKMTEHTQQLRVRVEAGKRLGKLPPEFAGIHTAEPTAQKMKGEHFDAFAEAYLNAVRQLHDRNDPEPKKDVYNRMISTCASCHTQYCPGPLVVIKKLPVQ